MFFKKIAYLILTCAFNSKSAPKINKSSLIESLKSSKICGINEVFRHNKYKLIINNKHFQEANIIAILTEETDYLAFSGRESQIFGPRKIFGYTKYKIDIYQNNKLIYKKIFRLSSFSFINRSLKFNQEQHEKNKALVVDYFLNLLNLTDFRISHKIEKEINKHILKEPQSNLIKLNEHGQMKAQSLNFEEISKETLDIIPEILNKEEINIIKYERIYNHGIYAYITIGDHLFIRLSNKNYRENLYKTLLKIEIIYLINKEIFKEDSSKFFIEYDKLSEKPLTELTEMKKKAKQSNAGKVK